MKAIPTEIIFKNSLLYNATFGAKDIINKENARRGMLHTTIENWMNDCIESSEPLSEGQFHGKIHHIRIGEDYDDIEDNYYGDWLDDGMYVERYTARPEGGPCVTIVCPWGYGLK